METPTCIAVWEDQVHVFLGRAHRRSKCGLEQNGADLPLLRLSVLVHWLGRQGEPVETSCSMQEEERPGVCSIIGWEEETPTCKGHGVELTSRVFMLWKGSYNHTGVLAGEIGLDIQQQTLKTKKKAIKPVGLPGCSS